MKNPLLKQKFSMKFITIVLLVWLTDVLTKFWAVDSLTEGLPNSFIDSFIYFTLHYNTGGILGIFPEHPILFQLMTGFAISLLVVFYIKTPANNSLFSITIALILGGALGNFTDRFFRHGVVDFIDVFIFGFRWPTFNLADAFITIGGAILIYVFYLLEKEEKLKIKENQEVE